VVDPNLALLFIRLAAQCGIPGRQRPPLPDNPPLLPVQYLNRCGRHFVFDLFFHSQRIE
jgi:hypothetical protein